MQGDATDLVVVHPPGEALPGVQGGARFAGTAQVLYVALAGRLDSDLHGFAATADVGKPVPGGLASDVEARMRRVLAELAERLVKLLAGDCVTAAGEPSASDIRGHFAVAEKATSLNPLPVRVAPRRQPVTRVDLGEIDRAHGAFEPSTAHHRAACLTAFRRRMATPAMPSPRSTTVDGSGTAADGALPMPSLTITE